MKKFLYIPWIEAHGDVLLREVFSHDPDLDLTPLRMTPKGDDSARRALFHFALRHPQTYSRLFEERFLAQPEPVHGLVLTLDWPAPMRIATKIAQSHGVPVILLPHEGVFMDKARFYRDPFSGANCSIADHFLAWGHLQKDIMVERGFDPEKVTIIASPKLQKAANYEPVLRREEYCKRMGLDPDRKIVMFCAQTLDNVGSRRWSRLKQAEAVIHLHEVCKQEGYQLLLRLPPVQHETILQDRLKYVLKDDLPQFVRPGEGTPENDAREANWHADCTTSISSTMLLEKGLMDGPSLAFDYVRETSPFVERGKLPAVQDKAALEALLPRLIADGRRSFPAEGWTQMERDFSNGDFNAVNAASDIVSIFGAYDKPIQLDPSMAKHQSGFPMAERARKLHSAIFKTLISLRIPYRNKLTRMLFPPLS